MNEPNSELEALLKVGVDGPAMNASRKRQQHPIGWEPIQIGERGGYITTPPQSEPPTDWNAFLLELLPPGMDALQFEVDGSTVEMRAWDGNIGGGELKRFYYFKARIRRKTFVVGQDLEEIISAAKKAKIAKLKSAAVSDRVYWLHVTDLQAGQGDGDSVDGLVKRALELPKLVVSDLEMLNKSGRPASKIFVPITGDLVEGISGWYEMQQFATKLDRRDQVKLVRRLLSEILLEMAKTGLPVHVAVVAGNHGEFRNNGKAFTSLSDNDDVAVVEQIAEAFDLAGIDNVTFSFPEQDRLSLTVEVAGWIVGLTHGHVAKYGNGPEGKILNWFKSMAATRDPIGDSDLLFTGHYHHPRFQSLIGDTYWIQGGALCDTSAWFSQSAGLVSDPCVLRGTITPKQRAESVMPFFWPRTRPVAEVVGAKK
jgi:predicted phosphodiesterase